MERTILLGALVLAGTAAAQQPAHLPPGWRVVQPVRWDTPAWSCLNQRLTPWLVSLDSTGTRLSFASGHEVPSRDSVVFSDGRLVSYDMGEFGGAIHWVSQRGDSVQIVEGNPVRLIRRPDTVLVFEGLAHLSLNEGHVLALTRSGRGWRVDTLSSLGYAPAVVQAASSSTYLVAAAGALLLVHASGRTRVLKANEAWGGLYPASLVRDRAGVIYVGARGAVFRLREHGNAFAEEWLAPDTASCFR